MSNLGFSSVSDEIHEGIVKDIVARNYVQVKSSSAEAFKLLAMSHFVVLFHKSSVDLIVNSPNLLHRYCKFGVPSIIILFLQPFRRNGQQ